MPPLRSSPALLLAALAIPCALAQTAPAPQKLPCKMSDPGVTLTADGWAGPNCLTTQTGSNSGTSTDNADTFHRDLDLYRDDDDRHPARRSIPLCRRGDEDVYRTQDGWSGPNCITSRDGIHPARAYADSRARRPICQLSTPGAHLTPDGWSGPDCITSKDGVHPTDPSALRDSRDSRPLCQLNSPGAHLTPDGWSAPGCITSQDGRTPAHPDDTPAPVTGNRSCLRSVGAVRANELVRQCLQVSPATHPPCNAQNSCSSIEQEIRFGCSQLTDHLPGFCRDVR